MVHPRSKPARRHAPILVRQAGETLVVDIHAHLNIGAADALIRESVPDAPKPFAFSCPATNAVNGKIFQKIGPKLNGVDNRIADMDALGVDVQAISPTPTQYFYFAPPEVGREAAQIVNNGVAEAVARFPDRFVGMGTVPLQNTEMAIAEMNRCVNEHDMRGIEICSHVDGRELSDVAFRPFFAAAEELGIVVFLHPLGFSHGQRLSEHYLDNIIGNPSRVDNRAIAFNFRWRTRCLSQSQTLRRTRRRFFARILGPHGPCVQGSRRLPIAHYP